MARSDLRTLFAADQPLQESSFVALINGLSHPDDIVTDLVASATNSDLKLASGSTVFSLNSSLTSLDDRVVLLEAAETTFQSNYYNKTDVDSRLSTLTGTINSVSSSVNASFTAFGSNYYEKSEVDGLISALDLSYDVSEISGLQAALDAKATVSAVASNLTYVIGLLGGKSDSSHNHDAVYLKKTDANFASDADLGTKAPLSHSHVIGEISGLDIYQTEEEVLSQIQANRHTLDQNTVLEDYYEKVEVDEMFRVKLIQYGDVSGRLTDLEAVPPGTADVELRQATALLISRLYGYPYSTAIQTLISGTTYVEDGYMENQIDYVVGGNENYIRVGV
jgi:hypothetical protein